MLSYLNTRRALAVCLLLVQINGLLAVSLSAPPSKSPEYVTNLKDLLKEMSTGRSLVDNCEGIFNPTCLKLKLVTLLEKYSKSSEYEFYPGVKIVKQAEENDVKMTETLQEISRNFPDDVNKRVDSYLLYKIAAFLDTHSINVKLSGDESARALLETETDDDEEFEDDPTDVGEGRRRRRRKKKVKKIFGVIAIALLIKKVLKALVIGLLFLLAGKALVTSLIALAVSGFVAFKTLISKKVSLVSAVGGGLGGLSGGLGGLGGLGGGGGHEQQYDQGHGHDSWGGYARNIDIELPEHLKTE